MTNRVVHFEIHAKDQDVLQKFYESVFGWSFQNLGEAMDGYRLIMTGPRQPVESDPGTWGINGGMNRVPDRALPSTVGALNAFVSIVAVEDIGSVVGKVKDAGGSVHMDVHEIPTVGLLAYAKDPEGNLFGVLQPVMPPGPSEA